ncbi:MAG: hypothetical protein QM296_09320 [Bacillota bacterium]|nr:hypothetical protein [Bacillota bacterium]
MAVSIVNIEEGYPSVDMAMARLRFELSTLRRLGATSIKVIHGYGSTGEGGQIRIAARRWLRSELLAERIRGFCPGELFGPFEKDGLEIVKLDGRLRQDPDWSRRNDGVSLVVL